MKLYTTTAVENLLQRYTDNGGEIVTVKEGSLGYGVTLCHGKNLKTAVIKELYLNEWSSGHSIRLYRKVPQKYLQFI
jgi:hypothetical protein